MRLNTLSPAEGAKHSAKRLGRGIGSGLGKLVVVVIKIKNHRTGGGVRRGFEGWPNAIIPSFTKNLVSLQ